MALKDADSTRLAKSIACERNIASGKLRVGSVRSTCDISLSRQRTVSAANAVPSVHVADHRKDP
jgi:hypothetical protein